MKASPIPSAVPVVTAVDVQPLPSAVPVVSVVPQQPYAANYHPVSVEQKIGAEAINPLPASALDSFLSDDQFYVLSLSDTCGAFVTTYNVYLADYLGECNQHDSPLFTFSSMDANSIRSGKYQQRFCYTGTINGICYSFAYQKKVLTISADREICKIKYVNECTGEFNVSGLNKTMSGKMMSGTCNEKIIQMNEGRSHGFISITQSTNDNRFLALVVPGRSSSSCDPLTMRLVYIGLFILNNFFLIRL